jgi:hypothetical protein
MLSGEGTLIGAAAVIIAAIIGGTSFKSWRRQEVAGRKLAQAERILEATYRARRALKVVRGFMIWAHELNAARDELKNDPNWQMQPQAKQDRLVTAQAYLNRLNLVREDRKALDECWPMARALFGEDLEKALVSLGHQFQVVDVMVRAYPDDNGADQAFTGRIRRAMNEAEQVEGQPNEVNDKIEAAVVAIEGACLPVLRA